MTYADLLEKRQKLNSVNFIPTANSSFIYAVARNKDKMDSVIKSLNKMIEPSENYKEYQRELDELNREFALKEEDGTIAFVTIPTPKGVQRGFKKLVGEGNSESKYEKALAALKEKYKEDIKEQEQRQKTYEAHLQKEVPPEDYRVFFIDADIIPDGLHPVGMEGCMPFIKEPTEGVPEERKKPK
jgi:hypothetical protein